MRNGRLAGRLRQFSATAALRADMKTRVTVLLAAALAVGAIAAPGADAKLCRTAADTTNRMFTPHLDTVQVDDNQAAVMFETACAAVGG